METYFPLILFGLAIAILGPCLLLSLIGGIIFIVLSYRDDEEKLRDSWQTLAKATRLNFTPGNLLTGATISGEYRNHPLKLETFLKWEGRSTSIYTRLILLEGYSYPPRKETLLDSPVTLETILDLLVPPNPGYGLKAPLAVEPGGQKVDYECFGPETDAKYLKFLFDLLVNVVNTYPTIIVLGGEAVPALQALISYEGYSLESVANQWLRDIAHETTYRLKDHASHQVCPSCLAGCAAHNVSLPLWQSVTYYGCRICGQSREFIEVTERVIAVLDDRLTAQYTQQNGTLRVNWSARRSLFDFDAVEVIRASDEEVERFAIQVGNDTDPVRKSRYATMPCEVSPECELSENSRRILRRMFGEVALIQAEDIR